MVLCDFLLALVNNNQCSNYSSAVVFTHEVIQRHIYQIIQLKEFCKNSVSSLGDN